MSKTTPLDLPVLDDAELDVVRLDTVRAEPIQWLWPNRFPLGKLSLVAGVQGKGKSFLTLDMAARLTTGTPWPDSDGRALPVSNVLLLAAEDNANDTICPRLDALKANSARVVLIKGTKCLDGDGRRADGSVPFDLSRDLHRLNDMLERNPGVRLLIIDPLTAYMPGERDANRDADVRAVLHPLGDLAAERNVAVVGVVHLRKNTDAMDALHRVMGSSAFTAYARAVWFVTVDRDDPDARVLFPGKLSIAKPAPALRFRIQEPGFVQWLGESDASAESAFEASTPGPGKKVQLAVEFLRAALSDGPRLAKEVEAEADDDGHAARTLIRAKAKLRVRSFRENDKPGEPSWWALPDVAAPAMPA